MKAEYKVFVYSVTFKNVNNQNRMYNKPQLALFPNNCSKVRNNYYEY